MSQYGNIHFYSGEKTTLTPSDFLSLATRLVGSSSVRSTTFYKPPRKYNPFKIMDAFAQGRSIKPAPDLLQIPALLHRNETVSIGLNDATLPTEVQALLASLASPVVRGNFRPDYASLTWGRSFLRLNSADNQDFDVVAEPDWDISISGWGMSENPKAFEREILTHPDFVAIVDRIAAELGPTKVCADWTY